MLHSVLSPGTKHLLYTLTSDITYQVNAPAVDLLTQANVLFLLQMTAMCEAGGILGRIEIGNVTRLLDQVEMVMVSGREEIEKVVQIIARDEARNGESLSQ